MKKAFFAILVMLLLIASASLVTMSRPGSSRVLEEFSGGITSNEIVFGGAGDDSTTKIHLNTTDKVKSVSFNISNGQNLGEYPRTPTMDIGDDGDLEWAYDEAGYGSWGHVNQFSDGSQKVDFGLQAANTLGYVTLPQGAQVTSAHIDAKGIFDTTFQKSIAAPDGIDNCFSLEAADINGDTYEDLVGVENIDGGDLFWFENPQSMSSPWTYHVIDSPIFYGCYVQLTDMDGDLDQDVVLSIRSSNGGIKWYENDNGDGSSWTDHDINMTFTWAGPFVLADVNGNGSEDIVLLADHHNIGRLAWIEKPSDLAQNWTTHIINNSVTYMSYVDVGDLDGDSNQDIIMSRDHSTFAQGGIFVYEGPDDPVNDTWLGFKIADFAGPHDVAVDYVDADADLDIIVANSSYNSVTWFEAPASPFTGFWTPHDMATGISGAHGLKFADMNGDARVDVVTGSQWGTSVYWLERPSSGFTSPWTAHPAGTNIEDARLAVPMDLDKANQLDIAAYGFDFSQIAALTESTGTYLQSDIQGVATGTPTFVVTGDFDNENASDVAFISYSGESLCVRLSTTDPTDEWTLQIVDDTLSTPNGLNSTDMDKDGDIDLIVATFWGNDIYWYENQYDTNPTSPWLRHIVVENSPQGEFRYLITGDVDGANGTDIIVYERWTDNSNHANNCLVWFESPADPTDGGQTWHRHVIQSHLRGVLGFDIADLDDDGYNDIALNQYRYSGGYIGNVSWARHPTGHANSILKWDIRLISTDHQYPLDIECINLDDDGVPDLVVCDYTRDSLKWYKTPANPTSPTVLWDGYYIDYNIAFPYYLDCCDVGGDGFVDIVVADSYNDRVVLYTEPRDPTVTINWKVKVLDNSASWAYDAKFGDFSGDGLSDVAVVGNYPGRVYWYDLIPQYSPSASLDVGFDTTIDWTITDLKNTSTSPDLKDAFNNALGSLIPQADTYGNQIIKVPLMLSGPERNASLFNVDVEYTATHTITGPKIVDELNEYLIANNATPQVDIPIKVSSTSPGKITIKDLIIELNEAPVLVLDIPSNYTVNEDSKNELLINLASHYTDDYTPATSMVYTVESYSNQDNLDVAINSGTYLSVDSTKVDNWFGTTDVEISATDEDGFKTMSNSFRVTVLPVNDEPLAGPDGFSDIVMDEGAAIALDLGAKQYFTDPDGDMLYYDTNLDEQLESIQGNLSISFDPAGNTLNFTAEDDWTISGLLLKIYCDDTENVSKTLSKNVKLDVVNIVEPITWSPVPIIMIKEDSKNPGVVDLRDYVNDPDHPNSPVSFFLQSQENDTYVDATLNPGGILDIDAHSNFFGDSILRVKAENQFNSAVTSVFVLVESVNDPPVISDINPADEEVYGTDTIQVSWSALDVEEDPLECTITLEPSGGAIRSYNTSNSYYTLTGLKDNTTYYWTVSVSDGIETVTSDKRMFRISFAEALKYNLEIDCPSLVEVLPGEKKNVIITVRNNEGIQNHITPWIEDVSPEISSFVDMPQELREAYISPNSEKTIVLVVDLTEFDGEGGDYYVAMMFQNGMNKQIIEKNLTIRAEKQTEEGGLGACIIVIPLLIVLLVIIAIVIAVLVLRRRKQTDEESFYKETQEEQQVQEPEEPEEEDLPADDGGALRSDIEDGLSKILETAGVDDKPEEDGVLEPEISESSPFDEEEGPPDLEEALKEAPAMDITPIGEEEEPLAEEEPSELDQHLEEAAMTTDFGVEPKPKVQTRYSYTYSKKHKKHSKEQEDELVELKPVDIDDDEPVKKSKRKGKKSGKKKKK